MNTELLNLPQSGLATDQASPLAGMVDSIELRGMRIHRITLEQTVEHIFASLRQQEGGWVVTPNLDILRRHCVCPTFRNVIAASTLNVADGMPLVWASRLLGSPLPERVNGTDLMKRLVAIASERGASVYFLGGSPGAAHKAIETFEAEHPELRVAGGYCPRFGFESDIHEIRRIRNDLDAVKPDIVFVGLGSPKQDVLINSLRLHFPKTWWLGVGVSFSFVSGDISRAPRWAQQSGIEWFYRLCAEPGRLAKRYLITGIPFFTTTMLLSTLDRFRRAMFAKLR
ncbi:MAG: WecB/TagA/CpsF family glycosyltransferase [bacterium]|nr:WecB/TagA/CpsF family glycosyltransferase [bacterium]